MSEQEKSQAMISSADHRPIINNVSSAVHSKKKASVSARSRYTARDTSSIEEDSQERESLLLRKQGVQAIPLSPISSASITLPSPETGHARLLRNHSSNTIQNSSITINDNHELQSIMPANSRNYLPTKLRADISSSSTSINSKERICSPRFCCGPNPIRKTFIVLCLVTLWSITIFCFNIQKQLSLHRADLGALRSEISQLEAQNTELRHENDLISSVLSKIAVSAMQSKKTKDKTMKRGPSTKPKMQEREAPKKKTKVCTASGQSCIFPFVYKDVVHRSCVKEWSYPRPWCATKVDSNGRYVSGDSSGWSECLSSCP